MSEDDGADLGCLPRCRTVTRLPSKCRTALRAPWTVLARLLEREWTDGLPVVPVTEALVSRMLAVVDRDPMEELGEVPSRMGVATPGRDSAVLAGCKPAYFPSFWRPWRPSSRSRSI